jgi:undecaprenyl-diphosphatase
MASDLVSAVVLGVIEGLTEFLPISSTGHLLVAGQALGFADPGEVFTVVIQLGAILAVCAYYHAKLWRLTRGVLRADRPALLFVRNLLLAALPAAVVGLLLNSWLEAHVFRPAVVLQVVAATMALGGVAIIAIERRSRSARFADPADLPWTTALGVGCCQLLAIIPGVSRSGASILGGMLLGIDRRAATEFSFFLAIPIMLGASGLKLVKHRHELGGERMTIIAVGFVVSFVVALAVVHWLIRYVSRRDFVPFAWYRLAAGLALAALLVTGLLRPLG